MKVIFKNSSLVFQSKQVVIEDHSDDLSNVTGYIVGESSGTWYSGNTVKATNYIAVSEGNKVDITTFIGNGVWMIAGYANNTGGDEATGTRLAQTSADGENTAEITIPSGVNYIRAFCRIAQLSDFSLVLTK